MKIVAIRGKKRKNECHEHTNENESDVVKADELSPQLRENLCNSWLKRKKECHEYTNENECAVAKTKSLSPQLREN
ncbi:hypothetical protein FA046_06225 [Pedobacter cryophilus]|uniref:Uncharacterized protein n=1 Tax=Pedobacter cryophilus TaxID=2571271 RepID=A0A4U1C5U0_9SPHI|nr:hypothetical protein FA046_06225 [Pedobacter cryophilus]